MPQFLADGGGRLDCGPGAAVDDQERVVVGVVVQVAVPQVWVRGGSWWRRWARSVSVGGCQAVPSATARAVSR